MNFIIDLSEEKIDHIGKVVEVQFEFFVSSPFENTCTFCELLYANEISSAHYKHKRYRRGDYG